MRKFFAVALICLVLLLVMWGVRSFLISHNVEITFHLPHVTVVAGDSAWTTMNPFHMSWRPEVVGP